MLTCSGLDNAPQADASANNECNDIANCELECDIDNCPHLNFLVLQLRKPKNKQSAWDELADLIINDPRFRRYVLHYARYDFQLCEETISTIATKLVKFTCKFDGDRHRLWPYLRQRARWLILDAWEERARFAKLITFTDELPDPVADEGYKEFERLLGIVYFYIPLMSNERHQEVLLRMFDRADTFALASEFYPGRPYDEATRTCVYALRSRAIKDLVNLLRENGQEDAIRVIK